MWSGIVHPQSTGCRMILLPSYSPTLRTTYWPVQALTMTVTAMQAPNGRGSSSSANTGAASPTPPHGCGTMLYARSHLGIRSMLWRCLPQNSSMFHSDLTSLARRISSFCNLIPIAFDLYTSTLSRKAGWRLRLPFFKANKACQLWRI